MYNIRLYAALERELLNQFPQNLLKINLKILKINPLETVKKNRNKYIK